MDQCSIAQARDQFPQLVYKVEAGEKIEVTLVTRNTKDFQHFKNLTIENWFE